MMENKEVAHIIKTERVKRGWDTQDRFQKEIRQRGFRVSRSSIANAEATGLASNYFLHAAEVTLDLERGSLMRYGALKHAQSWCEKMGASLKDYISLLHDNIKPVRFALAFVMH